MPKLPTGWQGDPEKQRSRLEIWSELARFRAPQQSYALLLPGSTRNELDVVIAAGYRCTNLYLVEKNAATLANLTRKCKTLPTPPRTNILRMLLSDAAKVLVGRGVQLDVAHLDFCQNVESEKTMIDESRQFIRSGVMAKHSLLAMTWQRGREHEVERLASLGIQVHAVYDQQSPVLRSFQALSPHDRGRLRKVYTAFDTQVTIRKLGHYHNKRSMTHMSWAVFEIQAQTPTLTPTEPDVPRFRSGVRSWR